MTGILGVLGGYIATQSDEPRPIPEGDEGARSGSHASPRAPLAGTPNVHKSAKSSRTLSPRETAQAKAWRIVDRMESFFGEADSLIIAEIARDKDARPHGNWSCWSIRAHAGKEGAKTMSLMIRRPEMDKMFAALHQETGESAYSSSHRPDIQFTSFRVALRAEGGEVDGAVNREDFPNEIRVTFRMEAVKVGEIGNSD